MNKNLLPLIAFLFISLFTFNRPLQAQTPCPAGCDADPLCVLEDMCFRFEYYGAVNRGDGTTQLKFKILNASRYPFISASFELPGNNLAAFSPQASYISKYKYSVINPYQDSTILFTGLTTSNFRYDQADVFRYVVDSATFWNGYNSTINIVAKAGNLVGNVTFDLTECEDLIIEPLPVELISFKGSAVSNGITLNWATATEQNNSYFSIQHSTDGRNFESAGYIDGHGNSNTRLDYTFTHTQPTAGINYYRLKQVDYDGTSAYSKVIAIESKGVKAMELSVYPNPVSNGEVTLKLQNAMNSAETAKVELRDMNGRLITSTTISGSEALRLNLKKYNLKAGIYILNLQAGASSTNQKIVIQ